MNKLFQILILLCIPMLTLGQEQASEEYQGAVSVQLGTDIGGAIPYPFKNIPSPFNAYPALKLSLGGKISFSLIQGWGIGAEVTYKEVNMKADARVENQKFKMNSSDGTPSNMYFTGTAKMNMEFTFLEVPLYARYEFQNKKDRILFGPYFAFNFTNKFETLPQKGYIGEEPNRASILNVEGIEMNFNEDLDHWDIGFLVGYERRLIDRLDLGIRVSMGFNDIFKSTSDYFDYNMLHMRGSVILSYALVKTKPLFKQH